MTLHERLIALQSDEELERKAKKAFSKKFWSQEEIDHYNRWGETMAKKFQRAATKEAIGV